MDGNTGFLSKLKQEGTFSLSFSNAYYHNNYFCKDLGNINLNGNPYSWLIDPA